MFDATAFIFFTFDEFFCFFSLHQLQINFVVDTFWSVWTSIQATNQKEELTDLYTCMYFSSSFGLLSLVHTYTLTRTRYLCFAIFFLMSTANRVYGLRSHRHTQTNAYAHEWTYERIQCSKRLNALLCDMCMCVEAPLTHTPQSDCDRNHWGNTSVCIRTACVYIMPTTFVVAVFSYFI